MEEKDNLENNFNVCCGLIWWCFCDLFYSRLSKPPRRTAGHCTAYQGVTVHKDTITKDGKA